MNTITPKFKPLQTNGNAITQEDIKAEISKANSPQAVKHETILKNLLPQFKPLDFKTLAFPELPEMIKQAKELENNCINPDGSYKTGKDLPKADWEQLQKLTKAIESKRVTEKHLIILSVENVLKVARENDWGIAKVHDLIYVFNGQFWKRIDEKELSLFLGKAAENMGINKFTARFFKFQEDLHKQFIKTGYLPTPEPEPDKVCINLLNGTFEITQQTQRLRPFDRNDFLTHQLPFEYNPQATAPIFDKYLKEVLPDESKRKVLAEYLGYIFLRNGSGLKLEKCLLMFGTGANGKSVMFEILMALLGFENVSNYSLESLCDVNGYYRAEISGKLLNYSSEISSKLKTSLFKQLVSGEPVEARSPYGKPFQITQYAKLMFNTNELPRDIEHSNAFFRRFLIIEFTEQIPEHKQDKSLHKKIIESELSGVFNWILKGLQRILENKDFTESEAINQTLSDYKKQSDTVFLFIDEYDYKPSLSDKIQLKTLYAQYKTYCHENGYRPMNLRNFRKRIESHEPAITINREAEGNMIYLEGTQIVNDLPY